MDAKKCPPPPVYDRRHCCCVVCHMLADIMVGIGPRTQLDNLCWSVCVRVQRVVWRSAAKNTHTQAPHRCFVLIWAAQLHLGSPGSLVLTPGLEAVTAESFPSVGLPDALLMFLHASAARNSASGEERGRHEAGVGSGLLFSSLLCRRLSVHSVSLVLAG